MDPPACPQPETSHVYYNLYLYIPFLCYFYSISYLCMVLLFSALLGKSSHAANPHTPSGEHPFLLCLAWNKDFRTCGTAVAIAMVVRFVGWSPEKLALQGQSWELRRVRPPAQAKPLPGASSSDPFAQVILRMLKVEYMFISADPGLSHGRGSAWDHLWCGLHVVRFLVLLELPNRHIFCFYWLDNAGCLLQTAQTFRHLPYRLLKLPRNCRMFPSDRSNPQTFQTGSWSCQLCQAKSFLFYWPATAGCSLQTFQTSEACQTVSWSCQTMGCGRPRLSFSTGPKLPDAPFKPFKRFKPSETFQTGAWSFQLWQAKSFLFYCLATAGCSLQTLQTFRNLRDRLLECKLWAVAGHVFPFLLARNCRMLPSNPSNASNPPKPSKPALGAASCATPSLSFSTGPKLPDAPFKPVKPSKTFQTSAWSCQLWQAKSFLFYCLATAGCFLQTLEIFEHLPPLVWTSSCPVFGALGAAKLPQLSFLLTILDASFKPSKP